MDAEAAFAGRVRQLTAAAPGLLHRALRHGGTLAELFAEHAVYHRHRLRRQAVPARLRLPPAPPERWDVAGTGLRVLGPTQTGYAHADAAAPLDPLPDAAAYAPAAARSAPPPPPLDEPDLQLLHRADAPDAISPLQKQVLVERAADAALAACDEVLDVDVRYHDRTRRVVVLNTEGVARAGCTVLVGLRVAVTLRLAGRRVVGQAFVGGAQGVDRLVASMPEVAAAQAVADAQHRATARPMPTASLPVVVAGGWGGVWLHEAIGHLLEADTAATGDRLPAGQAVAAPGLTLVDDATLPGGRGAYPFDDEGRPAACTTLIEDGRLRAYLSDRHHALRGGPPATGNARRQDYRFAPLPRMSNLLLRAGTTAPDDLVAAVADGLFVQQVGRGAVYPGAGHYVLEVQRGFRIEGGRLTHPVAGVRLTGRLATALQDIVGIGTDFQVDAARGLCEKAGQVVPVGVGMPTVLVRTMQVDLAR